MDTFLARRAALCCGPKVRGGSPAWWPRPSERRQKTLDPPTPHAFCCPLLTMLPHLRPIHRWMAERLRLVRVCAKLPPAGGIGGRGVERVHTGRATRLQGSLDFQEVSFHIFRPPTLSQLRELATFPGRCEGYEFNLTQDVPVHRLNLLHQRWSHLLTAQNCLKPSSLLFCLCKKHHNVAQGGATARRQPDHSCSATFF